MSLTVPDPRKTVFRALTYIYVVLVSFLTLKPSVPGPESSLIPGFVIHILLFLVLGFLVEEGFRKDIKKGKRKSIYYAILLALLLETLQLIIPGRQFAFIDLGSNILGLLIGLSVIRIRK